MRGVIDTVDTVITQSAQAPITVAYARKHIRALGHLDDELIATNIRGSAQIFEGYTGRQIMTGTRERWLDRFPGFRNRIEIPHAPLQSIVSVSYVDGDGVLQPDFTDGASPETLSYQTKAPAGPYASPGWIEPISGLSWPSTRCESGAVRVRYIAGYGDGPSAVPELIRGLLCYLVGNFDQIRNNEAFRAGFVDFPIGVTALMDEFKYSALCTHPPRDDWYAQWRQEWIR